MRPRAMDVLHQSFFWDSEMQLSFLRDASDRVVSEGSESELLNALESTAAAVLKGKWNEMMDTAFVNDFSRHRPYKYDSVRDLLRVIRNKLNHYRELPQEIQEILGPVPEGFHSYFSSRFPRLLIEVYNVMYRYCKEEEFFREYINENIYTVRLNDNSGGRPPPRPAPGHNSPSRVIDRLQLPPHENEGIQMRTLPTPENKNSVIMVVQDGDANESNISSKPAGHVEGRRIGKLVVFKKAIAKGSNGTVVLERTYYDHLVAVKRLVRRTHHDLALKEIRNLIASDHHTNNVRRYGMENDQDFGHRSLERWTCSLHDLILSCSESFQSQVIMKDQDSNLNESVVQLQWLKEYIKDSELGLWKKNGYPTPQLLKLMRDVVSGLAYLHEHGIIHRDLKPQNVLIILGRRTLCAKLSDMDISERLSGGISSLTQHATGCGSSGWQAPEILICGCQTRAVDLFSLGYVLHFSVTGGKNPYGDSIERNVNIVNKRKDLFLVENIPEAVDLFSHLLHPIPDMRPRAMDVLHHPFFWDSKMRLTFLRDVSDRVASEGRESELLKTLKNTAAAVLKGTWNKKMETALVNNINRYRPYDYNSVRDLLRVIRNKLNHYWEPPREIQEILGPVPEGFYSYFSSRFPRLLIEVYNVMYVYCKEEEFFPKYINENISAVRLFKGRTAVRDLPAPNSLHAPHQELALPPICKTSKCGLHRSSA